MADSRTEADETDSSSRDSTIKHMFITYSCFNVIIASQY